MFKFTDNDLQARAATLQARYTKLSPGEYAEYEAICAEMDRRLPKPQLGDRVYFQGPTGLYGGIVTGIATDGRLTYRVGTGMHGFSYVYTYRHEQWLCDYSTFNWYIHHTTANRETGFGK